MRSILAIIFLNHSGVIAIGSLATAAIGSAISKNNGAPNAVFGAVSSIALAVTANFSCPSAAVALVTDIDWVVLMAVSNLPPSLGPTVCISCVACAVHVICQVFGLDFIHFTID